VNQTLTAAIAALLVGQDPTFAEELARRAAIIKPRPGEYKWRQIPWTLDLAEGIRLAAAERRPLLMWVSGDDPLERC
jgi:hypothetical protein